MIFPRRTPSKPRFTPKALLACPLMICLWFAPAAAVTSVQQVKNFNAGTELIYITNVTEMNGTHYFSVDGYSYGTKLWKSDGTADGTVLVKDFSVAIGHNPLQFLTNLNGTLYFTAYDSTNGTQLWKSNGTVAGTGPLKLIRTGGTYIPTLVKVVDTLFFSAQETASGSELWKSDGTEAGTVLVKDIYTGTTGSSPENFTSVNGTLFFSATTAANGTELWKSDGTAAGTVMVKDIYPGTGNAYPGYLASMNGMLYFNAGDPAQGFELWKSDGTEAGTALVKDIRPGTASTYPVNLTNVNGTLFFSSGPELWKSDGTADGTVLVRNINPPGETSFSLENLTNLNGTLYFTATTETDGTELWKSDGTEAGTVRVKDINPAGGNPGGGSYPTLLTPFNGLLYFTATNGVHGKELWQSDGTAQGTVMVSDFYPGSWGFAKPLHADNGALYFSAATSDIGVDLWKLTETPKLSLTPESRDFGTLAVGGSGVSQIFTLQNNDAAPLSITAIQLAGSGSTHYSLSRGDGTNGTCGAAPNLASNQSCTVSVTFAPTSDGTFAAALQIDSSDVQTPTTTATLTGTGVAVFSAITAPASDTFTNAASVAVTGTANCSGGSTVSLVEVSSDNGLTWQGATGTTSWSISLSLPDGRYTIRSRATMNGGIVESPSAGVAVTVDRQAPTGTLWLDNGVWTLDAKAIDGDTCLTVIPNICGYLEMSLNGSTWQPATTTPGAGSLWLRDRAGNTTYISITITASSAITSPASGSYTNASSVAVAGTANCTGGGSVTAVEVSADGGATWQVAAGTTSWSATLPLPQEKSYQLKSRATCSGGIVESPGTGITVIADRTSPTATLALYYGTWALSATDSGVYCFNYIYPSICGPLEISLDGSSWQPAVTTPGTGGPLWLRDRAGNTALIGGTYANGNGGPILIEGAATYYSFLQHAVNAVGTGSLLKVTTVPYTENLVLAVPASFTLRGGYDTLAGNATGITRVNGSLTVQAGEVTLENLELAGSVSLDGGTAVAGSLSIL